jgi:hypothetical protein
MSRPRGRPRGSGSFAKLDEPLLTEMAALLADPASGVVSVYKAAQKVAGRACFSSRESTIRRLQRRYCQRRESPLRNDRDFTTDGREQDFGMRITSYMLARIDAIQPASARLKLLKYIVAKSRSTS